MPIDKNPLLALAEQLDEAKSAKEKLDIYNEMGRVIREAQKIYRLVEAVKATLADVSATKALEAPITVPQEVVDLYPHLR